MLRPIMLLSFTFSASAFASVSAYSQQGIFDHFNRSQFTGAVSVVSRTSSFDKTFGDEGGRPIKSSDHFLIGSVTKQFTAAAILKLVDQGKIRLDESVIKYVPSFRYSDVTIHHLLAQVSGISEFTGTKAFENLKRQKFTTLDPLVAVIVSLPQEFRPGLRWAYSNSNYLLLAKIVEAVAGESWWSFTKREIIDPAGMNETDFLPERGPRLVAGHEFGRDYQFVEIENVAYLERGWANGAGGIESTVGDLARWNSALYGGHILSVKSLQMMTSVHGKVSPKVSYGYGLFIVEDSSTGETVFYHPGGIPGFTAYNSYFPARHMSVVALGNFGSAETIDFARALARLEIDHVAELNEYVDDPGLQPFPLDQWAGEFVADSAPAVINLVFENGKLYASLNGQAQHRLVIRGQGHFYDRSLGIDLVFKTGSSDELVIAGSEYIFKRKD